MSGVYYVHLKWASTANNDIAAKWGRYLLTFPSRQVADELFRAYQDLLNASKQPVFSILTRQSPQFWVYDAPEGWTVIINVQARNDLPAFRDKYSVLLLSDWDGRNWPMIPIQSYIDTDWLSGADFFIRNRHQPELYWWANGNRIYASTTRRSKFRVKKVDLTGTTMREPVVLVRNDEVTVHVVQETANCNWEAGNVVGRTEVGGYLQIGGGYEIRWTFGALVNKEVGLRWGDLQDHGVEVAALAHMTDGGGDQWELV